MTAEIVVMNKLAVALAADSAATIRSGSKQKVYSANKLFRLAHDLPIGVLIYGSADFMGVPWEVLVKEYRSTLRGQIQKHVDSYASGFVSFLQTQDWISDDEGSRRAAKDTMRSYLEYFKVYVVRDQLKDIVNQSLEQEAKTSQSDGKEAIRQSVDSAFKWANERLAGEHEKLVKLSPFDGLTPEVSAEIERQFKDAAAELATEWITRNVPLFGAVPDPSSLHELVPFRQRMVECALLALTRQPGELDSGVVFAGFGSDDHFPATVSMSFRGKLCGHVQSKRNSARTVNISREMRARVIGFAQSDMIQTFMYGVDPELQDRWWQLFRAFISDIPKRLESAGGPPELAKILGDYLATAQERLFENAEEDQILTHGLPFRQAVEFLSKDEMAELAESLIRLTSLKRRVTMTEETVGGPIDVAVISRGEGFVYVKRKHYFDLKLNPHYVKIAKETCHETKEQA